MSDPLTKAIADSISALLALAGMAWTIGLFNLLLVVAAITWVVKRVWNAGNNKNKKQKQPKYYTKNYYVIENPKKVKPSEKQWSPTGWYLDEEKGEWVAPDYIKAEANTRWEWDDKKRIWIDKSKKKRR